MASVICQWGTIPRFREQLKRLFTSTIWCIYDTESQTETLTLQIAKHSNLWWEPQASEKAGEWKSTVTLGPELFEEILAHPIPIDNRALRAIKKSPMAIDIYCWMTYRMSYLRKPRSHGKPYKCNLALIIKVTCKATVTSKNTSSSISAPCKLSTPKQTQRQPPADSSYIQVPRMLPTDHLGIRKLSTHKRNRLYAASPITMRVSG